MLEKGPRFLHRKYKDLNASGGVQDILDLAGKDIPPQDPESRIQAYLDFLQGLVNRKDIQERGRGIEAIKQSLRERFVIKPEEIPESYFQSIIQRHREEGHGDIEIPADQRAELTETVIQDQKQSLDVWIDYLASPDAKYPDYLKYWTVRSILRMGRYDKEKKRFTDRYGGTVSAFPELNQQALSIVLDAMEKKFAGQAPEFGYDIATETKTRFLATLEKENFAKLYGLAIEEFKPISETLLENTAGQWIKYPRGSDHQQLVDSLASYGTGWCIRGASTAKRYLQGEGGQGGNDLEIFYSNDEHGRPTVPRVVIVSSGERISEVRGVAKQENLDPHIGDVVQRKLAELPDGKSYQKKNRDMKTLTVLERKAKANEQLTKDDLIFLYEINAPIEGFGYQKDPRIQELRASRDPKVDAPIVLDCSPDQIAWSQEQVNQNTKAYIGPLFSDIFNTLGHLEHIYTKFPEGRIKRQILEIGGKNGAELEQELDSKGFQISPYARHMLKSKEFTYSKTPEQADLIRLTVQDLGFPSGATTDQIYKKAEELGLELCPSEVGPRLRLAYTDQPLNEWIRIGMKQITDPDGNPRIFDVGRDGGGLWLDLSWTTPGRHWDPGHGFMFRLRPSTKA